MSCIFCKILADELPSKRVYEDEHIIAFHDIAPAAPVHILVIPREHIPSIVELTEAHNALIAHIFAKIPTIARDMDIPDNFRVVTNTGAEAGQTVHHLHFHVLGGKKLSQQV